MWVVKLGGSLFGDASLPMWLDTLARLGGGRVVIVAGGGGFADEVRRRQARWGFDDLAAHNMAVLAMAQGAYMLQALCPELRRASTADEIRLHLHGGQVVVWTPYELLRDQPDARTNWGHTSDRIALDLARRLNVERLVIVKSCPIDDGVSLVELAAAGILDDGFAPGAESAGFAIDVVARDRVSEVGEQLRAGHRPPGGLNRP